MTEPATEPIPAQLANAEPPTAPLPTCPKCGAIAGEQHLYCEQCGVNLRWARNGCVGCSSTDIGTDGFCQQCGLGQPAERDRSELAVELAAGPDRAAASAASSVVLAAGITDRGHRRKRNEDAMACEQVLRDTGVVVVAVVCDGVASVERGDEASKTGTRVGTDLLVRAAGDPAAGTEQLAEATDRAARAAGAAVTELAVPETSRNGTGADGDGADQFAEYTDAPSSTYVSAVVTADAVMVGWIGDSRAYWLADGDPGGSACLTRDHAIGGVLTRWLGADTEPDPEVRVYRPAGRGTVLLCSDGLWNYLPEPDELAAVALPDGRDQPLAAARRLTQRALDAGGRDNITVLLVPFPPAGPDQPQRRTEEEPS